MEQSRRVVGDVIREVRATSPDTARRLEDHLHAVELDYARHRRPHRFAPRLGQSEERWSQLLAKCLHEVRRLEEQREQQLRAWPVELATAQARLEQSRDQFRTGGMGPIQAAALVRAENRLAHALGIADTGDLPGAIRTASMVDALLQPVDIRWRELETRLRDPRSLRHWDARVAATVADSARSRTAAIVVSKLDRRVDLYVRGRREASFPAELGVNGLERKLFSGDQATPEGRYRVVELKKGGATRYGLALLIDYPNLEDRRRYHRASEEGSVPPRTGIGNLIEIHGRGGRGYDWTDGCVALTDEHMAELFRWVRVGTPVTIVGFDERGASS